MHAGYVRVSSVVSFRLVWSLLRVLRCGTEYFLYFFLCVCDVICRLIYMWDLFSWKARAEGSSHEQTEGLRKCILAFLRGLFFVYSFVWAWIFMIFWGVGHFRTARYGVYIGLCRICMCSRGEATRLQSYVLPGICLVYRAKRGLSESVPRKTNTLC